MTASGEEADDRHDPHDVGGHVAHDVGFLVGELRTGLDRGVGQRLGHTVRQRVGVDTGIRTGQHVGDRVLARRAKSSVRMNTVVLTMLVPSVDRPLTRRVPGFEERDGAADRDAELVGGGLVHEDLAGAGVRPAARCRGPPRPVAVSKPNT